jgi:hypothetical protein
MSAMAATGVSPARRCEALVPRARGAVLASCFRASIPIAVLLAIAAGAGLLLDVVIKTCLSRCGRGLT